MRFGLIGRNLSHSFSKKFFTHYFKTNSIDAEYENIELNNIEDFRDVIAGRKYSGFNVTNPYKELIIEYLDDLHGEAKKIMAVNCIKIVEDKLIGYNTDAYGFEKSIEPHLNNRCTKALVLGSGGASKAVQYVLTQKSIDFRVVGRSQTSTTIAYSQITEDIIDKYQIIINTTPLGMFPNIYDMPILPYQYINQKHFMFDLIYNPQETVFLSKGRQVGATIQNGLDMLHYQAIKAIEILI